MSVTRACCNCAALGGEKKTAVLPKQRVHQLRFPVGLHIVMKAVCVEVREPPGQTPDRQKNLHHLVGIETVLISPS